MSYKKPNFPMRVTDGFIEFPKGTVFTRDSPRHTLWGDTKPHDPSHGTVFEHDYVTTYPLRGMWFDSSCNCYRKSRKTNHS